MPLKVWSSARFFAIGPRKVAMAVTTAAKFSKHLLGKMLYHFSRNT
jgi:hypothetical protein